MIKKFLKFIVLVFYVKLGEISIFKNFNLEFRFWFDCDRSVIIVVVLSLDIGLGDKVFGFDVLLDEKFFRI